MVLCITATLMATSTFAICTGTETSGFGTTTGSTMTGTTTTPRRLSQISHFSPVLVTGEFCFCICPFQPPNIFPISSSLVERYMYFVSSNDFVSHKTMSSIFNVSSFLIEKLIQGSFSILLRKLAIDIPSIISTNRESIFCPSVCL